MESQREFDPQAKLAKKGSASEKSKRTEKEQDDYGLYSKKHPSLESDGQLKLESRGVSKVINKIKEDNDDYNLTVDQPPTHNFNTEATTPSNNSCSTVRCLKIAIFTFSGLLGLITFIIGIVIYTQQQSSTLDPFLSSLNFGTLILTVGIILLVITLLSFIAIHYQLMYGLHCYWLLCLILTCILILIAFATMGLSLDKQTCSNPTNYFLDQLHKLSNNANTLYCSSQCPCNKNNTNITQVQQCSTWNQTYYSTFMANLQNGLHCSGWCTLSPFNMSIFSNIQYETDENSKTCFNALKEYLDGKSYGVKVVVVIISVLLVMVLVLLTIYLMVMSKEEDGKEKKKKKKEGNNNEKEQGQQQQQQQYQKQGKDQPPPMIRNANDPVLNPQTKTSHSQLKTKFNPKQPPSPSPSPTQPPSKQPNQYLRMRQNQSTRLQALINSQNITKV